MHGGFINKNLFFTSKKKRPKNLLLNGRSSLSLILKFLKPSKVYLPFYICDTVINTLSCLKIKYNFYPINNSLRPKKIIRLHSKDEYILRVPYFGLLKFNDYRNHKYIYDLTGSFFYTKKNIMYFNSLRKFFHLNFGSEFSMLQEISLLKANKKEVSMYRAPLNYEQYQKNECRQKIFIKNVVDYITKDFFSLNFDKIKTIRNNNFTYYHKIFKNKNELNLKLNEIAGPQYYPLLIKNGNLIKKKLINNKIFVPTLWSELKKRKNKGFMFERYLSEKCIFLPVDESINKEEIFNIINLVKFYVR